MPLVGDASLAAAAVFVFSISFGAAAQDCSGMRGWPRFWCVAQNHPDFIARSASGLPQSAITELAPIRVMYATATPLLAFWASMGRRASYYDEPGGDSGTWSSMLCMRQCYREDLASSFRACSNAGKPPATWATLDTPMSFNALAANAERPPEPQYSTSFLLPASCVLCDGL